MYQDYVTIFFFIKKLVCAFLILMILCVVVYLSQIWSGRSTLEERKEFLFRIMKQDSVLFSTYKNSADYKNLVAAKNKDSLDVYLERFIETYHLGNK